MTVKKQVLYIKFMAKIIEQGFETLVSRLAPLQSEYDTAASHRGSVKSCVENNFK
jgi:hypothetical protein